MGDVREIIDVGGVGLRAKESMRSNQELRDSGLVDEDFYLRGTDAGSIRDRNNEVIGQWI